MATNWQIGDRIQNRWEIYKILRGGMGIVYVVYDHEWQAPLAAKTFQDEVFTRSPAIADRFTQEALTWINFDAHQNVTQALSIETIQGKPYLFLEYVSGGDLSGWIGTPGLTKDLPQVLRFAIQFCDGMIHALSKGIIAHRDIKPQNCLITADNTLKVTDFGLAKVFDDAGADEKTRDVNSLSICLTRTGVAAGTPTHMAPEQFDDAKRVDVRADIYSFGVMLYQMIEGQMPFVGRDWEEFARLHKTHKPPTLNKQLPEINAVIQRSLAKNPSDRFLDFSQLQAELADIYEELTGEPAPHAFGGKQFDAIDWNNKGMSLNNLGQHEEAIRCCERAIDLNPHYAKAWNNKGNSLNALGLSEEANACYDRAIKLNPNYAKAWNNKGVALKALGRGEQAIECFDRAIDHNPRYEKAWTNKGAVLVALSRMEEAIACYDQAIVLNPGYVDAWSNREPR